MTGIHDEERRFGKFKSHMTLKARTGRGSDVKETKAGQGYIRQEAVGSPDNALPGGTQRTRGVPKQKQKNFKKPLRQELFSITR